MRRHLLALVGSAVFATVINAQTPKPPKFSQYPAVVETARVKTIDLRRNPRAYSVRSRLSEGLRGGINFAGHYVVVGWGCGTGCVSGAIIDGRTGTVYWPEQLIAMGVWYGNGNYTDKPIEYKKNSRMLIIRGLPGRKNDNAPDVPSGDYYYEWKKNKLRQVMYVSDPVGTNGGQ